MKKFIKIVILLFIPLIGVSQEFNFSKLNLGRFNQIVEKNSSYTIKVTDSTVLVSENFIVADTNRVVHFGDELQMFFEVIKKYEVEVDGVNEVHYLIQEGGDSFLDLVLDLAITNNEVRIESSEPELLYYLYFSN